MSQAQAEQIPSVAPLNPESLFRILENLPINETPQDLRSFFNAHQIPQTLARHIEVNKPSAPYMRATVMPHPSLEGIRLVQIDAQPHHDRELFLSFGINTDDKMVDERLVPLQAFDISGQWGIRGREVIAYHSWAKDTGTPNAKTAAKRQAEKDPRVVLSILPSIIGQINIVPPRSRIEARRLELPETLDLGRIASTTLR